MTTVVTVKKEVEKLKQRIIPKEPHYCKGLHFCNKGGPHGFCRIKVDGGKVVWEPATFEMEYEGLKSFYERVIATKKWLKKRWPTFEAWYKNEYPKVKQNE